MEDKAATFLYSLAGLMITFAGFSALLLALRPAAGAKLSLLDRYGHLEGGFMTVSKCKKVILRGF